ncbi:hypothetical protein ASPVEDRAFT_36395 [Aspergillus versicolor CBS 583.65]|uniref:Uncharacterized protein n=1 Tax=Aspergillus versicolor CBS 583.65 TaxID=1036611 RepID=A0A1L9P666_ASPVE|nr:uncharacterized protein ASPVEDRAFT_36395 [Aspergillus versicolor CBS 583.65]OJI97015.1 hypothetical protein ASPVEDRAFT_36395 [Aspergillus versicolor CBS 583.65]
MEVDVGWDSPGYCGPASPAQNGHLRHHYDTDGSQFHLPNNPNRAPTNSPARPLQSAHQCVRYKGQRHNTLTQVQERETSE